MVGLDLASFSAFRAVLPDDIGNWDCPLRMGADSCQIGGWVEHLDLLHRMDLASPRTFQPLDLGGWGCTDCLPLAALLVHGIECQLRGIAIEPD